MGVFHSNIQLCPRSLPLEISEGRRRGGGGDLGVGDRANEFLFCATEVDCPVKVLECFRSTTILQ
jgi:hypothetical protein